VNPHARPVLASRLASWNRLGGWQLAGSAGAHAADPDPRERRQPFGPAVSLLRQAQVASRLNIDFFNVFNIPGIPKTPSSGSGIIDAQYSGNGARALQSGLRLSW